MSLSALQSVSPLSSRSPLARSAAARPKVLVDGYEKAPDVDPMEMAEARKAAKTKHKAAKIIFAGLGATGAITAGVTTVATIAVVNPGLLGPLGPPLNQLVVDHLPAGAQQAYHWATDPNPRAEDPSQYGQLYMFGAGSKDYEVLANSGETSPNGNNIPQQAIENGTVIVGFEGIDGSQGSYVRAFNKMFNSDQAAVPLNQNMLFIHEGNRPQRIDDIQRILSDYKVTKQVQAGESVDLEAAFEADPSVETGYNVIKEALDEDLDVLVFAHSGGGAQSVEVLNLLSSQGYRDEIGDHVKIVLMAGAAPAQDAVEAGVKPDNALFIGMQADLVAELGHVYVDPRNPMSGLLELAGDLKNTSDFTLGPMHSPDGAIVPNNLDHVHDFFYRGIGGTYLAETPPG